MNRSVVDRDSIESGVARRRASDAPTSGVGYGSWVAAKVVVIPTAVLGLVNRFLHRKDPKPIPLEQARRRAGIYVWRPTFGPDGMPTDGEIIPISESAEHRKPLH